jgi:hypothetical protein
MALIGCAYVLIRELKGKLFRRGENKLCTDAYLSLGCVVAETVGHLHVLDLSCSVMTNLMDQTIYNQHTTSISALARRTKVELRSYGPLHEYSNFFFQIVVHVLQLWPEFVHHV